MTPWWLAAAVVTAILLVAGSVYFAGVLRLRAALRRFAAGGSGVPLMPDLPRGLRSSGRDLKALAERLEELGREAHADRFGFDAIFGSISEGVFIVDRNMRIRLANPGVRSMFGLAVEPTGRTVLEAFRSHQIHRIVEGCLLSGAPVAGEAVPEPGRAFEISVTPAPLEDGQPGAVVVIHDITRIKKLENVRREFVANVSHELRTPLTIINGYLETLREAGFEDRAMAENALGVMSKHADRLKRLADDLLTISQAESRAVPLDVERVDLRQLLRHVVDLYIAPVHARGAAVEITADEGDLSVEADPAKLEHLFGNLLDNALTHGNHPGLKVDFSICRAGPGIDVRVTDNGPGIPFADQEHIFERFYRVHKHRSRATGGTGLGLSIVKNLVEAHGGSVSVRSDPGRGATFHVVLPARQLPPPADAPGGE